MTRRSDISTKDGKMYFVRNLCDSICDEIIGKIAEDEIPDHWTGHELRYLLFLKFQSEVTTRMKDGRLAQRRECDRVIRVEGL